MRHAACMIRDLPRYRREAFVAGLSAVGYSVDRGIPNRIDPSDVLIIWNRYTMFDGAARMFERAGATVIIAENGYIGGDAHGRQLYALAKSHHNGAGSWHVGEADRWSKMGVELKPWRERGRHILLLPQRGIGEPGVAMPAHWTADVYSRLQEVTERPIKIRSHPGKDAAALPPVEVDLEGAWAAVTWASGAGIRAIIAGVPVFHELKNWIGAPAARFGIDDIENPFVGDRTPMLHRLAWAQFSVEEIAQGEPFRCLLRS